MIAIGKKKKEKSVTRARRSARWNFLPRFLPRLSGQPRFPVFLLILLLLFILILLLIIIVIIIFIIIAILNITTLTTQCSNQDHN